MAATVGRGPDWPVIFLDVDGALCTPLSFRLNRLLGLPMEGQRFDPIALFWLRRLVKKTGAVLVLSSSWRGGLYYDDPWCRAIIQNLYDRLSRNRTPISDATPFWRAEIRGPKSRPGWPSTPTVATLLWMTGTALSRPPRWHAGGSPARQQGAPLSRLSKGIASPEVNISTVISVFFVYSGSSVAHICVASGIGSNHLLLFTP